MLTRGIYRALTTMPKRTVTQKTPDPKTLKEAPKTLGKKIAFLSLGTPIFVWMYYVHLYGKLVARGDA